MSGLYGYWDNVNGYVAYIGKDSYIEEDKRDKDHNKPSAYKLQAINRALQNNPDRYEYFVLAEGNFSEKELNEMESQAIAIFKTFKYDYPERSVFNFTKGGDGSTGYKFTEESKQKMSDAKKDFVPWIKGKHHSDETKQKISESLTGNLLSDETKQKMSKKRKGKDNPMYGRTEKNNPNWKGYARIIKDGFTGNKQNYTIKFNGKSIKYSISIDKLVKWFKDNYPDEELIIDESIKH